MARRFKKRESIEIGLRRLATREVGAALAALERHRDGPAEGVHRARVACKRIRAWLALVEAGMDTAEGEAEAFKQAAKRTSGQRDLVAIRLALSDLAGDRPELASPAAWADGQLITMSTESDMDGQAAMHAMLVDAGARISGWCVEGGPEAIIRQGVERGYAAARSAFFGWRDDHRMSGARPRSD
ncbi:MAG: CHAD domain-containing protein [Phycisphaerales bacterium]|nr:CHAD domain-containing protein [Phycisphaerales bacterium]